MKYRVAVIIICGFLLGCSDDDKLTDIRERTAQERQASVVPDNSQAECWLGISSNQLIDGKLLEIRKHGVNGIECAELNKMSKNYTDYERYSVSFKEQVIGSGLRLEP